MPPKVLVVDDEQDLQHLVRQNFRRKIRKGEIEFDFAFNGYQALEKLEEQGDFDMVLSDINMPEMDGLTLIKNITEKYPLLRACVVSAYGDMDNVRTAMNNGAFDFVTKPIDFDDLEITINKTLKTVKELKAAQESQTKLLSLENEMQIGQRIQTSFLPNSLPKVEGWNIAARFYPARDVSGDFYDIFKVDEKGNLVFVVADVCGKGVGAALFMALIRSLLRAFSNTFDKDEHLLANVIRKTQEYVENNHDETGMFVTLFIGKIDVETGHMTYINAGHNFPLTVKDGKITDKLMPTGPALGILPGSEFVVKEYTLEKGEILFGYTDGVNEAFNPEGELFGNDRLFDILKTPHNNATTLVEEAEKTLKEFTAGAPQSDDITILAVCRE